MKANNLYFGTMKFVWLKLAFTLALGLAITLWCGICLAIGVAVDNGVVWAIMLIFGIGGGIGVYRFANAYIGYLIKAGHVAVIAEASVTGVIPQNQFEYGKAKVKARFAASNVYFVVDALVTGAVKQLQRVVGKVGDLLGEIPGVGVVVTIAQVFIEMALGYVDECCLGYTFNNPQQGAFKSACDGVVIYFQNWKALLKSALKSTIIFIVLMAIAILIIFLPLMAIFQPEATGTIIILLIAVTIAAAVKKAFIDSYMMITMMVTYMQLTKTTQITFDLYGKLCGMSKKFKELFEKGQSEQAPVQAPVQPQV